MASTLEKPQPVAETDPRATVPADTAPLASDRIALAVWLFGALAMAVLLLKDLLAALLRW